MALIEGNNRTRPPIRNGASRRRGVSLSRNRCARALSRFDLSEGGTRFRIQTMLSKYRLPFIIIIIRTLLVLIGISSVSPF